MKLRSAEWWFLPDLPPSLARSLPHPYFRFRFTSLILQAPHLRLRPSPPPRGNARVLAAFPLCPHLESPTPSNTQPVFSAVPQQQSLCPKPAVTIISTPWVSCLKVKGLPSDQLPPDRTPPLSGSAQLVHGIPQLRHPATTATPLGYHVQP